MKFTTLYTMCLCASLIYGQEGRNLHRYFWANRLQFAGQADKAHRWYQELFKGAAPIQTYVGYIHFLYEARRYAEIVELSKKIADRLPDAPAVQLIIALALKKTNQDDAAYAKLIELNKKFKHHPEITFHTVESLLEHKELNNALTVIDDFLNAPSQQSRAFLFHFIKSQIYAQLGKPSEALNEIQEALKINPHFDKAWLVFAALQEEAGQMTEAIKGYSTFLQLAGNGNKQIEQHLLKLLFKQRLVSQEKIPASSYRGHLDRALGFLKAGDYLQARANAELFLSQNPESTKGRLTLIQIMTAQKKFGQAIELTRSWIMKEPDNSMWYQLIHLIGRLQNDSATILTTFEDIARQRPHSLYAHLYYADSLIRKGDKERALKSLTSALERTADPALKTKIYFQMGTIYYEEKKYTDLEQVLEQGLHLGQNYPPLLNLLAYYHTTHTNQKDKATRLIDAALAQDPHNPHFLDTKAVILYKNNKYKDALALLASALKQEPEDSTILIHTAKTLHKLGDYTQAYNTLKHANTHAKTVYEKEKSAELLALWSN